MAQDGANSCTVMSIYNPTSTYGNVKIVGYTTLGFVSGTWTFQVGPKYVVRVCSDDISTTNIGWTYNVTANFGSAVGYARITYPSTYKIDAYIAWCGLTDYYDPETITVTRPLPLF